jgi:hypothetical protein
MPPPIPPAISTYDPNGRTLAAFGAPRVTGRRAVMEDVARAISTPKGSLFYAPTTGVDHPFDQLVNATLPDSTLSRIEAEYTAAAVAVAGVLTARFRVVRNLAGSIEMGAFVSFDASVFGAVVPSGTLSGNSEGITVTP